MKRLIVLVSVFAILASGVLACGPRATPTPVPLQVEGWEGITVRTVCLEVEEAYPGGWTPYTSSWEFAGISGAVKSTLMGLGLEVASEGDPCDATLSFQLDFDALSEVYTLSGRLYTGARVTGTAVFSASGHEYVTLPIEAVVTPPPKVEVFLSAEPKSPEDAPFGAVWPEPVVESLAHLWGPQALVQATARPLQNSLVRWVAVRRLGELGPNAPQEAVPALINRLDEATSEGWSESSRQTCAEALRKITGQDFGEDADRWQQWWEEQE